MELESKSELESMELTFYVGVGVGVGAEIFISGADITSGSSSNLPILQSDILHLSILEQPAKKNSGIFVCAVIAPWDADITPCLAHLIFIVDAP